jgi:hypothetical protein
MKEVLLVLPGAWAGWSLARGVRPTALSPLTVERQVFALEDIRPALHRQNASMQAEKQTWALEEIRDTLKAMAGQKGEPTSPTP